MGLQWIWAHLLGRPGASLAAIAILALVGVLIGGAVAWQQGLERVANSGADEKIQYLMARGSEDSAERSVIEPETVAAVKRSLRRHTVGPELVHMGLVGLPNGDTARLTWRGIDPEVADVRPYFSLSSGEMASGDGQVVIGNRAATELGIGLGDTLTLDDHQLTVVGVMGAGLGFAGSEIWLPRASLSAMTDRHGASLLVVRDAGQAINFLAMSQPNLGLVSVEEVDYLAVVAQQLQPLRIVAWILAGLLILAAIAGTVSAAAARADARRRQLAIARSLGVHPLRLGVWLGGESLFLALFALLMTALVLLSLDGSVWRLGTVAPELIIDSRVLLLAALGVVLAALIQSLPVIIGIFRGSLRMALSRQ